MAVFFQFINVLFPNYISQMKKISLILLFLVNFVLLQGQTTISGTIRYLKNGKSQPLPYVSVMLCKSDTLFVGGTVSDEQGSFSIPSDGHAILSALSLYIKCLGYASQKIVLKSSEVGTIIMKPSEIEIGSVVVNGHQPVYKLDGNALKTNIAGTLLSQLGNANDVLYRLPFITGRDGDYSVLGRGTPKIYINNRLMRNKTELQMIKSEDIKDVQIIMNPGAEYESNTKAVIKITTKRPVGEGFSGRIEAQSSAKRAFGHNESANINYRSGGLDIFGEGLYQSEREKSYYSGTTDFTFQDKAYDLYNSSTVRDNFTCYLYKVGFNYVYPNGQSMGANYNYVGAPNYFKNIGGQYDKIDGEVQNEMNNDIYMDSRSAEHTVSLYYDELFAKKYTLHFDVTFLHSRLHDNNLTEVNYLNTNNQVIVSAFTHRQSTLYAGKLWFKMSIGTGKFIIGTEDSYTLDNQKYIMENKEVSTYVPSSKNLNKQGSLAAFTSYDFKWHKFSINIGLRWEYVHFDYFENDVKNSEASRINNSLSPDLSLSYDMNDKTSMSLPFKKSIVRPDYSSIRSSLVYAGPYEVEGGNPLLKPSTVSDCSYLFSWKDLQFNLSYSYLKDTDIYIKEHFSYEQPILIFHPKNANMHGLSTSFSYSPTLGLWKPITTIGIDKHWLSYNGQSFNKPIFNYSMKNIFTLPSDFVITADLTGSTEGNDRITIMLPSWSVDLAIRKSFLNKKLQVNLAFMDLFKTRNEGWKMKVSDVMRNRIVNGDTRQFLLTVSYLFNSAQSKYKGKNAAAEEIKRL